MTALSDQSAEAVAPRRVAIARIPSGQSIDLFSAVGNVLDAALGGAMLVPGNGGDVAATIVAREDQPERQAVAVLRQAANILAVAMPKERPAEPDDADDKEAPTTVAQLSRDETGWTASVGGAAAQAAADMAKQMLAAFVPAFQETGAGNYLSWDAVHEQTGERYSLIVVRPNGLTPHEARQRAEQESERLQGLLAEALQLLDDTIETESCSLDHHGYCQEHMDFSDGECYQARIKRFVAEHAPASVDEEADRG